MVEDEQITLESPGDVVTLGLCVQDPHVASAKEFLREGIRAAGDGSDYRYRIDGRVLLRREFETVDGSREPPARHTELIVDAGVCPLVVRSMVGVVAMSVGGQLVIEGPLTVIADYEWDDFAIPDVRTDWLLRSFEVVGETYLLELDVVPPNPIGAR